jgi:hypothetical protein
VGQEKKHVKAKEETKRKNVSVKIMIGGWGDELGKRGRCIKVEGATRNAYTR